MTLKQLLPPNIYEVIDRARICTVKQIVILSIWDIKKSTNLCVDDILLLKNVVTDNICPISTSGNDLKRINNNQLTISTGCISIDNQLNGGLLKGTITEVYGESASGKTQLALQIALTNWAHGCVYICTEDTFPSNRFEEMKMNLSQFDPNIDYGKNIYVEHITEAKDLMYCVKIRLPKLLAQNDLSLIVIDSIAAPFRCESTNYVKRAGDLREIATVLTTLAQEFNLAVLCINQVTASFEDTSIVLPSLGLAWSNMVTTRLMLKKTLKTFNAKQLLKFENQLDTCKQESDIRELLVVFAPHIPNTITQFIITSTGIQNISN